MRRIGVILIVVLLFSVLYAQSPPVLEPIGQFTQGTTCEISWTLSDGTPVAYHIQVLRTDTGAVEMPDSVDSLYSIFPIPPEDAADSSYIIGLDLMPGTIADNPLTDGATYCYRIQYIYEVAPDVYDFSDWSDTVCSRQDNSAPVIDSVELPIWTNAAEVTIPFHANDAIMGALSGAVESIILYYRTDSTDSWTYYDEWDYSTFTPPISHYITFNSADATGDGYYQFYIAGRDALGNETNPNPSGLMPHPMHAWTRFDTETPTSEIDADAMEEYYTTHYICMPFTAGDTYSGVMDVLVRYRLDGAAPQTLDSLFYGGMESVDDEDCVYFPANGCYDIFFIAVDSAGNEELLGDAEASFCIDTVKPEFSSPQAYDTTTVPHRFDVNAEAGYSNDASIWVLPQDAEDIPPESDTYASGIESVFIAQDEYLMENLMVFPYSDGASYLYLLTAGDGNREIYVSLKDVAGNFSDTLTQTVVLDTDAPTLSSATIYDRTSYVTDVTDELLVNIEIVPDPMTSSFYKVFLTQNESELNNIPEDGWRDFADTMSFEFTGFYYGDTMSVWIVAKDSAGNVSNAISDYIIFNPPNNYSVSILSKRDINGPDTTGTYTDTTLLFIKISFGRDVDSIMVKDDGSSEWTSYYVPDIAGAEADTEIVYELTAGDGIRTIYVRGESETYEFPTDKDSTKIILDTRNPDAGTITVKDISTGFDTVLIADTADAGYTNSASVKVIFSDAYDPSGASSISTGLYHLKAVCSTEENEVPYAIPSVMNFTLPDDDGSWTVSGFVQDSAGNWSSAVTNDIVLDTYRPTIISVVLKDRSTGDENYTDEATVLVQTLAEDSLMGQPAYIAMYENPDLWPQNLHSIWQPFEENIEYTFADSSSGTKVLYVAVKDNAGNISYPTSDDINLGISVLVDATPFDISRGRSFNSYTNSPTIGVFIEYGGIPPAEAIVIEDSSVVVPDSSDPRWQAFPEDSTINYTFTNANEGEKTIRIWLKSLSGTIYGGIWRSIILDETPPELPEGFSIWDTTSTDIWPSTFKGHLGWSNEIYVYGSVPQAEDTLSNVDSLHFTGPFIDDLWTIHEYSYIGGMVQVGWQPRDSIGLILDGSEGSFDIIGGAMDGAGNRKNITIHGGYDIQPPTLMSVAFYNPDTASLPSAIPLYIEDEPDGGHLWKVCYHIEEVDTIDFICVNYRLEWGSYPNFNNVDFPADSFGLSPAEQYSIYAVAVDSAGNASEPVQINLWSKIDFKVVDINDTLDSEYTGSRTVLTIINSDPDNPPDSMRFAESHTALTSADWLPFSRTSEFTFENATNETKRVYAQLMFEGSSITSEYNYDEIILDTVPPVVVRIDAEDPNTGDPDWSGSQDVKIIITGADDELPGIVNALRVSESPDFDYYVKTITFDVSDPIVIYTAAPEPYEPVAGTHPDLWNLLLQGKRRLFAQVLDRAENASQTVVYDIFIDWETTEVINFPNPFNPEDGPTYIRFKGSEPGASVEINIYDMFGNPVWQTTGKMKSDSYAGQVEWDGKNDNGEIVANGGYICIADFGGGKIAKRKIAVWKGK